jgi:hypothetical protein
LTFNSYRYPSRDYGADNGRLAQRTCIGISTGELGSCGFPIDIELGLGLAF